MTITIKKYCQVCNCPLPAQDEVFQTCTEGIIEKRDGFFCDKHKTMSSSHKADGSHPNNEK